MEIEKIVDSIIIEGAERFMNSGLGDIVGRQELGIKEGLWVFDDLDEKDGILAHRNRFITRGRELVLEVRYHLGDEYVLVTYKNKLVYQSSLEGFDDGKLIVVTHKPGDWERELHNLYKTFAKDQLGLQLG